jgi:hypothetical protein
MIISFLASSYTILASDLASETGRITGKACEKTSGEPISGAKVVLVGKGYTALTDASGQYEFGSLIPGDYTLSVTAENFKTAIKKMRVESREAVVLDFQLEPGIFEVEEIVVIGKRRAASVPSKVIVRNSEIKRVPGTGGDMLKVIQALPGISSMNDFSGQLYIRGGGPEDNSFYFDRIPLSYPYHFGGFSSTLNSDIIKQVDVYAGGFDAEYGDAQAVIDILSHDGRKDKINSTMNVNMLMAEGLIEGAFGKKDSWYLAARRSYIDVFPIKTDVIVALPRFWDYQTKLNYELGKNHDLSFAVFGSEDFMELKLDAEYVTNDPDLAGVFHWRSGYHSQGVTLRSTVSPRLSSFLTFFHNYMLWDMAMGKGYFLRAMPHIYNLRGDASLTLSEKYGVETGFNAGFVDSTMKAFFIRPPAEEEAGELNFTDSPKVRVDTEATTAFGNAYAKVRYTPIEPVSLTLGGRGDYYEEIDEFTASPRASLSLKLPTGADLRLAYGEYIQPPDEAQSSPDWGNPDLSSITASHYVAVLERQFLENNVYKLAIYYKQLDNLVTPDLEMLYLNQGDGFAKGMEIFLRHKDTKRFFGWISYSYSLSKRRDKPDAPWRLYSYDQTYVLTAVANYKLTPTWEIGGKWRYATGTPYTPVIGSEEIFDPITRGRRWKPIFGEKKSERLTPYHRLDVRISKVFKIRGAKLTTYLEVMNAYNHKNLMAIDYNEDYTEEKKVYMLPIIPYFGITANF